MRSNLRADSVVSRRATWAVGEEERVVPAIGVDMNTLFSLSRRAISIRSGRPKISA
jgi:hypothetical protein